MDTAIRNAASLGQAQEWALVLAAAGIPHRLLVGTAGVLVIVPDEEASRAEKALDDYDRETNVPAPAPVVEPTSHGGSWAIGLGAATCLLAFFALIGPPDDGSRWYEHGSANASRILGGEAWRAVTALTLHKDAVHVASNAVATAVLLTAVVERLGPGVGLALMLLAGASANVISARVHGPPFAAVGFSTATFGAIGILAGVRIVSRSPIATRRARPWTVLAATLVLLAMLGTSKGSDVIGHALGVGCGLLLGLAAGLALRRSPRGVVQAALVGVSVLVVIGCWFLALAGPPLSSSGHR